MRLVVLCFFLIVGYMSYAQPGQVPTELLGGKKYYVHFVQQGNTLYGIHKLYDVPVESIVVANPGCDKGLVEGQKILVPVPLVTVTHIVAAKETLFGISKKYGVTVDAIRKSNPQVDNGLKVGQKLIVEGVEREVVGQMEVKPEVIPVSPAVRDTLQNTPEVKVSFSDSIIEHVVLDHETLYLISKRFMVSVEEIQKLNGLKSSKIKPGDKIKIPVKKEKIEVVQIRQVEPVTDRKVDSTLLFPVRSNYSIALMLPFFLDKAEGNNEQLSSLATEFYMGAKLAMDSLERLGLKATLYVYDVKNDTLSVKKILQKPEFAKMDLIIGPLSSENAEVVARWCRDKQVRMVCPVAVNSALLKNNRMVHQAVPSDGTLLQGLASYTLKNHDGAQIILIKSTVEKDQGLYEAFRSAYMDQAVSGDRPKLIDANVDNFATFMKKGTRVILIFPTNDKTQAVKFMNNLNTAAAKLNAEDIRIFGTKEWNNFDDIKGHFKNKFNFHFSSPNDLDYNRSATVKLHRKYRAAYNSDMSKMAVQGFDVTLYFCSDLFMNRKPGNLIMNKFELVQKGVGNGMENATYFILEQEDYEFIRKN